MKEPSRKSDEVSITKDERPAHKELSEKIDETSITKHEMLAHGAFGKIFKATFRGQTVVIKSDRENEPNATLKEYEILKMVTGHPHIIQLLGGYHRSDTMAFEMILELAESGSLKDYYNTKYESKTLIPLYESTSFVLQIVSALAHIQAKFNLLHLDIKPENILLFLGGVAKICDFGNAHRIGELLTRPFGSPTFIDPAQLKITFQKSRARQSIVFNAEAAFDVYSLAILLCTCVLGNTPYSQNEYKLSANDFVVRLIFDQISKPKLDCMPPNLAELVTNCWNPARDRRPNMQQIYESLQTIQPTLPR